MKLVRNLLALSVSAVLAHAGPQALAQTGPGLDASSGAASDPVLRRSFVVDREHASVIAFDEATLQPLTTFRAGVAPVAIASNAASSRLYLTQDTAAGSVTVLNAVTGDTIADIAVGAHPLELASDFAHDLLYVTNNAGATLSIIDTATNIVIATLPVGRGPNGIGVDHVRGRIYVASPVDGTVTVIDRDTRAVVTTFSAGRNPGIPRVDERTGRVLVNNLDDNTVTVLDASGTIAVLPAGQGSTRGTFSPAYRKYYLPNAGDDSVTVVDADSLRATIIPGVATEPVAVRLDEDSASVLVAGRKDATVTIVDARDDRIVATAASDARKIGASVPQLVADSSIVAEYYDAADDLYFHSGDVAEKRLLDDGVIGATWQRTEAYWRGWTAPGPGRVALCRFAGTQSWPASPTRFAFGSECDELRGSEGWIYDTTAYFVAAPEVDGSCTGGTAALYRLFNPSAAVPSYRFTPDQRVRDAMASTGWIAQGVGADNVFACTPTLRAAVAAVVAVGPSPGTPPPVRIPIAPYPRPKEAHTR